MEKKHIEIYRRDGGFYVGRMLKNGKLSSDAARISEQDICTMFTEFFQAYCAQNGTDKLALQGGDGFTFMAVKIDTESGMPE